MESIELDKELILPNWTIDQAFKTQTNVCGLDIKLSGIAATNKKGLQITGSAGQLNGNPQKRAQYEFLERCSMIDAMDEFSKPKKIIDAFSKKATKVNETAAQKNFFKRKRYQRLHLFIIEWDRSRKFMGKRM